MKKLVSMVMGLAAAAAFATPVPNVQVIDFFTEGPDTYADGTVVQDGECYALVWSSDGVFEGIKADGTAKDENDKVVYIGAFAKDGRCKPVSFQFKVGTFEGGKFEMWLLDTRVFENGVAKVGKDENGELIVSCASQATTAQVAVSESAGSAAPSQTLQGAEGGAVAEGATVAAADVVAPQITGIAFEDDFVKIDLNKTVKGVRYVIIGSENVMMTGAKEGHITSAVGETATLIAPKFGNFYRAKALVR